jgi:phosphoglycolate phosphatase-like HAD superfamily hydrolase
VDLVQQMCGRYDLAIVTSRSRAEADHFVERFELDGCFAAIVAREDVRRQKPAPEPVRRAAERLGHAPEQCIVVGDTVLDIRAGKRAGALTVGVLSGFGERAQLERQGPDLILETMAGLASHLPDGADGGGKAQ